MTQFDSAFRHSQFLKLIDDTDPAITSNVTTVRLSKDFTPTLNTSVKYTIPFNNALYYPHAGHDADAGGILSSSGFTISGDTNEMFLNDDGKGNVRLYYIADGTTNTYVNNTQGTIDYTNGSITLNSLFITSVSNVDGATSTAVRLTVIPNSVDVIPVRNQVIEIDETNTTVTVSADTYDTTSGIGYTASTSYAS